MTKKLVNIYRNALKTVRRKLMKTSLEQFICFGVKSDMPQKQIMAVYAGYSLIGTLLLLLPVSSKCDIPFIDHLFTVVSAISTTGLATVDVASPSYLFIYHRSHIMSVMQTVTGNVCVNSNKSATRTSLFPCYFSCQSSHFPV